MIAAAVLVSRTHAQGLASSDLSRLRSVGDVALSPDGQRIAYTITMRGRPGRPYGQPWVTEVASPKPVRLGGEKDSGGGPLWSPDGKWLAFSGHQGEKSGLFVARPDGSEITFLTSTDGTNSPLPGTGNEVAWSPDSKRLAFVSATLGEGAADSNSNADPIVITRYLYKPDAGEGMTRFNDNKRLHIFVVDAASKQVKQLTNGGYDEHSIDWSPDGSKLVFASNRDPITQTNGFKAAIPTAGIANLISYNYMTYYNQYEEMGFGQFLHQGNLMDVAWERSALKHIAAAHTPTLIIHGENDNDVPIAEAEQLDATDRSIAWYEKHFPKPGSEGVTNVQP